MASFSSPLNPWQELPRGALKNPQGKSFRAGEKIISELWINHKGEFVRQNFYSLQEALQEPLALHTLLARWAYKIPDPKTSDRISQKERVHQVFDFFCSLYENSIAIKTLTEEIHDAIKEKESILYWTAVWLERSKLIKLLEPFQGLECYHHTSSGRKFLIKKVKCLPPEDFL